MAEGLREIAEQIARRCVDLLGEKAEVIGVVNDPAEEALCIVQHPGLGEATHKPEAADDEAPLPSLEPIVG